MPALVPGGVQLSHVIFSLKTFAAGMLAYWIALSFGLTNPYWALGSVYIVTNPLAGAVASKAVYRLGGTVLGAGAVIVLVPGLVQVPVLLIGAVTLWAGICLFMSMLDRTPRAYMFMLAGYTAALTGFSLVDTPELSFSYATSRMEEIGIGILCASLIGRVVLPQQLGPVLAGRVDGWLANAAALTRDVLGGEADPAKIRAERNRLAADATGLRALGTQVGFEGARARAEVERLEALQYRMVMVLPQLSEIADLRLALAQEPRAIEAGQARITRVLDWLALPEAESLARADDLLAALARPEDTGQSAWAQLLLARLCTRLADLVTVWADCRMLHADLQTGESHRLRRTLAASHRRGTLLHIDYGIAIRAIVTMMAAAALAGTIWICTGWTHGAGMLEFAIILCSFMAAMDNSVPVMKKVLWLTLIALGLSFFFQFAVLPAMDGFAAEAAALALVLIPCGIMMAVPASWFSGFQISVNFIYMMTLGNDLGTNFVSFSNASLGTVAGVIVAASVTALIRVISAEHAAERLLRAGWNMVIDAASGRQHFGRDLLYGRMLDRLGQIVPRLAALPAQSRIHGSDILRDLRVALTVSRLQQENARHPLPQSGRILAAVQAHYGARRSGRDTDQTALLTALDAGLQQIPLRPDPAEKRLRDAMVGLRSTLCPDAPPPQLRMTMERISA